MKRNILIFIGLLGIFIFYFFLSLEKNSKLLKNRNYPKLIYLVRTECPCCIDWENFIRFKKIPIYTVSLKKSIDIRNLRKSLAMPETFYTCDHIAFYKGYFLEGHIPLKVLNYLDKNKPEDWLGVTMKIKAPGAPGIPLEGLKKPQGYEIFAVHKQKDPYPFMKIIF